MIHQNSKSNYSKEAAKTNIQDKLPDTVEADSTRNGDFEYDFSCQRIQDKKPRETTIRA